MPILLHRLLAFALWAGFLTPAWGDVEIIAHRGAMKLAPENTLAAQRLAYELGAEIVECDIRISSDGVPIIMHDHSLDRTTNTTGSVGSRTLQELKQLDAGSWFGPQFAGERIPTLAEMLEVAKTYNRQLLLDIKGQFIATQVVQAIRASGIPLRQISFLTWWTEMTAEYVRLLPGAKIMRPPTLRPSGASILPAQVTDADLEAMRVEGISVLFIGVGPLSRENIRRFQAAGFGTSLIYLNKTDAFNWEDAGADSFWTDYTDVTVSSRRKLSQEWANWADASGVSEDQCRTWQDPDGDGLNNLLEYAFGTDPLQPDRRPAPAFGFQNAGGGASNPAVRSIDWPVDLRENWSQFLDVTPQISTGNGPWSNMSGSCCTTVTPAQLLFKFPVGTSGKAFYRLKIQMKQ